MRHTRAEAPANAAGGAGATGPVRLTHRHMFEYDIMKHSHCLFHRPLR
jgi:hypothetical protein